MNIKVSKQIEQRIILVLVPLILLGVGWKFVLASSFREIKLLKQGIKTASERSKSISEIHTLDLKKETLIAHLPLEKDKHSLLGIISKAATDSGFDVQMLTPNATHNEFSYTFFDLDLRANGNFKALTNFLRQLETSEYHFAILEADLKNIDSAGTGRKDSEHTLDIAIKLRTYLRQA